MNYSIEATNSAEPTEPTSALLDAVRANEPGGPRAERMVLAAFERVRSNDDVAPEQCCYCLREALDSLLGSRGTYSWRSDLSELTAAARSNSSADGMTHVPLSAITDLEALVERSMSDRQRRLKGLIAGQLGYDHAPHEMATDLFNALSEELNTGLHSQVTQQTALELYEQSLRVLSAIFPPLIERIPTLDKLVGQTEPGAAELAELRVLLLNPVQYRYFFAHVDSEAWFSPLDTEGLLMPPPEAARWEAVGYLERIAKRNPELLGGWVSKFEPADLDESQCVALLRLASVTEHDLCQFIVEVLQAQGRSEIVVVLSASRLLECAETWGPQSVLRAADQILSLAMNSVAHDRFSYEALLAARAVDKASNRLDAMDSARVFLHKISRIEREDDYLYKELPDISTVTLEFERATIGEIVLAVVVKMLSLARARGAPVADRIALVREIASPETGSRILAAHLMEGVANEVD